MISHSSSHILSKDFSFIEKLAQRNFVGKGVICKKFQEKLCLISKRTESILTTSGTAALEISLHVLRRLKPKCRYVGVSAYVCPAVMSAILRAGLKPLFLDVLPDSMNLNMESAHERIDESVLVLICTNIGGFPDNYTKAGKLSCALVSDCAQAIGSQWNGRPVTRFGQLTILSFGSTKMLTAGYGGALLMDDRGLYELASSYASEELDADAYRKHGFSVTFGQHFSDLNAGLGLSQINQLETFIRKRQIIARKYSEALESDGEVNIPRLSTEADANYYRYYFFSDQAQEWLEFLRRNDVNARPSISHDMSEYFPRIGSLPNLRKNSKRIVSLPIYPNMTRSEIGKIAKLLRKGPGAGL